MSTKMYVDVEEVCEDWGVSRAMGKGKGCNDTGNNKGLGKG